MKIQQLINILYQAGEKTTESWQGQIEFYDTREQISKKLQTIDPAPQYSQRYGLDKHPIQLSSCMSEYDIIMTRTLGINKITEIRNSYKEHEKEKQKKQHIIEQIIYPHGGQLTQYGTYFEPRSEFRYECSKLGAPTTKELGTVTQEKIKEMNDYINLLQDTNIYAMILTRHNALIYNRHYIM